MTSSRSYRRSALKLIARVRILGKRGAPALSSVATLAALALVIVVAWVVVGFTRVSQAGVTETLPAVPVTPALAATPVSSQSPNRSTTLAKRDPIVYTVEGDTTYFHAPVHTMHAAERCAVSLSVAKVKGLGPCPICFKK